METESKFPEKICVSVWGDKINPDQLKINNSLKIDFDLESREYNGRWYTAIKAWKLEVLSTAGQSTSESNDDKSLENSDDDKDVLPF